jgi:hypothetical protein
LANIRKQKQLNEDFKLLPIPFDSFRKITRGYPIFLKLINGKIEKVMKDI